MKKWIFVFVCAAAEKGHEQGRGCGRGGGKESRWRHMGQEEDAAVLVAVVGTCAAGAGAGGVVVWLSHRGLSARSRAPAPALAASKARVRQLGCAAWPAHELESTASKHACGCSCCECSSPIASTQAQSSCSTTREQAHHGWVVCALRRGSPSSSCCPQQTLPTTQLLAVCVRACAGPRREQARAPAPALLAHHRPLLLLGPLLSSSCSDQFARPPAAQACAEEECWAEDVCVR